MCQPLVLGLVLIFWLAAPLAAQDTAEAVQKELNVPAISGAAMFKAHCASCHGERADGAIPAARHQPGLRNEIITRTVVYYSGSSNDAHTLGWPPKLARQHQLSRDEIQAVLAYLRIVTDPVRRGEIVYKSNCILCHGIHADGNGRASSLYTPRPADLRKTNKDDNYKRAIIRLGGAPLGRSSVMPPWNGRITDLELQDLLLYLRSILSPAG